MATLNLTKSQFGDIALIWLFDQVMNPEQVENERLKEFIQDHRSKIRTPLTKYYLDSDGEKRLQYKRIKGVFDGSDKSIQQIRIGPDKEIEKIEKGKEGLIKKVLKKVILKQSLSIEDETLLKELINENIL
jgi:hypothetical protein